MLPHSTLICSLGKATPLSTFTEILPGQTGQVFYEGFLWQARTEG